MSNGEILRGVEVKQPLAHLSSHARWLSKGMNANPFAERVAPLFQVDLPSPACIYLLIYFRQYHKGLQLRVFIEDISRSLWSIY